MNNQMENMMNSNRIPKQKRSEETRNKIIEAGKILFSRDGYHNTSSKKIAKEAGVAIGSFYNYFPDKKHLLFEIYKLHAEKIHKLFAESMHGDQLFRAGTDGRTVVRNIVKQALIMHEFSPGFHREITALIYSDPEFAAMHHQQDKHAIEGIMGYFASQKDQLRVDDMEAAAMVIGQAVEAVVHTIKIFGAPIEEKRLTDALGDMIYRFLYKDAQ